MQRASAIARRIAARFGHALSRPVTCSACGRMRAEVTHMIAGPHVYLCDGCVEEAARQLSPRQPPPEGVRCRICRQRRATDAMRVVGSVSLCADCFGAVESVLAEARHDLDPPHDER
jgi:hypothetical protein